MSTIFGVSRRNLLAQVEQLRIEVNELVRLVTIEVQHLRTDLAPAVDEAGALRLQRFLKAMHEVVHLQIKTELPAAEAIAGGLRAVMQPLPYGVAGGRARARHAWRSDDGTFMSYDEKEEIELEAYERMAHGGRARARGARRGSDGRFL